MTSEEICEKYPKIFENAYPSVEKGWLWLIDELCKHLQFDTDNNKYPQVKATQVKEKFGGLRFYFVSEPLEDGDKSRNEYLFGVQRGMIDMIESLSYVVCEFCGQPGAKTESPRGWRKTLCSECGAKYEEGKAPWRGNWDDPEVETLTPLELMFGKEPKKCTCCCHRDPYCPVCSEGGKNVENSED